MIDVFVRSFEVLERAEREPFEMDTQGKRKK
jgi:hypothetical protein